MIGKVIANYKIIEKLGEGGMGTVYKAIDFMAEREVALKMLRPDLARQPHVVERFRSEARALAKLNHPNIATLYSFFRVGDDLFMAMEFVKGETLASLISGSGPISFRAAMQRFHRVLEGISYAHQNGIVHRDIKPSNIMLTPDGSAKVMDFGIARVMGTERLTMQGGLIGTLEYMSPEQIQGLEVDPRSDIYSLGIVLYEMLGGRLPFSGSNEYELMRAHVEKSAPSLRSLVPDIPSEVENAIARALAKRPELRFQTVSEFRNAVAPTGVGVIRQRYVPGIQLEAPAAAPVSPNSPSERSSTTPGVSPRLKNFVLQGLKIASYRQEQEEKFLKANPVISVFRFPKDRSIGFLFIGEAKDEIDPQDFESPVQARGDLRVPSDRALWLRLLGRDLLRCDSDMRYVQQLSNLRQLELCGTDVSDKGLSHIRELTQLRHLDLDETKVSDAGLVHLAGLTRLRYLCFQYTGVNGGGLKHLAGLRELRELDLSETNVSDTGLVYLDGLNRLESLYLGHKNTELTVTGVIRLSQVLPKCRIHFVNREGGRWLLQGHIDGLDGTSARRIDIARLRTSAALALESQHEENSARAGKALEAKWRESGKPRSEPESFKRRQERMRDYFETTHFDNEAESDRDEDLEVS